MPAVAEPVAETEEGAGVPRRMSTPDELKQFREWEAVARSRVETAGRYAEHDEVFQAAALGMRRTWKATKECGQALRQMKAAVNAWKDIHGSWLACCRSLGVSVRHINRLISYADLEGPPGKPPAGTPLPEAEGQEMPAEAAEPFSALRESLRAAAIAHKSKLTEPGADKPPRPHDAAWVADRVAPLQKWCEEHGLSEGLRLIEAFMALVRTIGN